MLRRGGNAIDAAIAAQAVLGLTEPQSSGLGGGAFLLYHDGRRLVAWDGRETAPAAAGPSRFLLPDGVEMDRARAIPSGRSVGVPGVPALLAAVHRRYGRLPWATLFAPGIALAERGFPVSARLHAFLARDRALPHNPAARRLYYLPDGQPLPAGALLKNPDYAATLRLLARHGDAPFYRGAVARDIVAAVRAAPDSPGDLTRADLARYRPLERQPLCRRYRGLRVCGMPPPSSGTVAVLQMLALLAPYPVAAQGPLAADNVHRFAEAGRLAYADRARYLADPAFVPVPLAGLLDPDYLATRRALIDPVHSMGQAAAGVPPGAVVHAGAAADLEAACTSQIVIVDRYGGAVTMTTTIEDTFGSRILVPGRGYLLNNQLTDFSFAPLDAGQPAANRVQPGKRPRSSMAPLMLFDPAGRLWAALGSPGGSAIPNYVAQTVLALVDWQLDPQQAVSLPHYGSRNGPTELEAGRVPATLAEALAARGHPVATVDLNSGLAVLRRTPHGWRGGADPRRDGVVLGD